MMGEIVTDEALDATLVALAAGAVAGPFQILHDSLARLRGELAPLEWSRFCYEFRSHPVHQILLRSPIVARAFLKPRGYAGDAPLIDLIYGRGSSRVEGDSLGLSLYNWEFNLAACQSVRHRRQLLAREIDEVTVAHPEALVLSLACGHLREIDLTANVEAQLRITAIDQDPDSVACVAHEYAGRGVDAQVGTVADVIRRRLPSGRFALAYAAGLYDYLSDDLAQRVTAALFRTLISGGRLLIANFTPCTEAAGYMEAVMDWHLKYRNESQMAGMLARVPDAYVARIDQFRDDHRNVTYLRAVRE